MLTQFNDYFQGLGRALFTSKEGVFVFALLKVMRFFTNYSFGLLETLLMYLSENSDNNNFAYCM